MLSFIVSALLVFLLFLTALLLKTYRNIPLKELKRQARGGDEYAAALYKVAGYGKSVNVLLWTLVILCSAAIFVFLIGRTPSWLAFILIAITIGVGAVWIPTPNQSWASRTIARYSASLLHWLIDVLYPLLARAERLLYRFRPVRVHTGMYTTEDLVELLKQQKGQLDSRIPKEDLAIASNALTYGIKRVADVMTPRRMIKAVNIKETVGPVLMEELHKSGLSRFPVYEGKKDNFVGMVYMRDMVNTRSGGLVKNIMDKRVYFVHDESELHEVLQAFIRTHYHMFLVVNSFEEIVGLITLEDVLEQIIGKPIVDEFDQYDDVRAVAAKHAAKEHAQNNEV